MSDLHVVQLRETPNLSSVPERLRHLASLIESGDVTVETGVLVVIEHPGDWPAVFGYGDHLGSNGNIAVLELAKNWFVTNLTKRTS